MAVVVVVVVVVDGHVTVILHSLFVLGQVHVCPQEKICLHRFCKKKIPTLYSCYIHRIPRGRQPERSRDFFYRYLNEHLKLLFKYLPKISTKALEESFPALFTATHVYTPSTGISTSFITSVLLSADSRAFAMACAPFFNQ